MPLSIDAAGSCASGCFSRAESVLCARGRAFLVYIDSRSDGDSALSLAGCCLWLSHSSSLDLFFHSNLPGRFCVRTVNVSGGWCVLIPLPPPFPSPLLKACLPSNLPLRRQHGVTTPRSRARLSLYFPPSYRPQPHPRPRTARDQYAVPLGPAPYCMTCSRLRLCIAFNCTYTIYMYYQPHPLPLVPLQQLTTSPRAPLAFIHH